jgi:hypothetical protein
MKKRDYDTMYDETTGGTETHVAVDTKMKNTIQAGSSKGDRLPYEEGFASASGVRPETAETGGRIRHPESKDAPQPDPVPKQIERENAGLADD